MGKVSFPCYFDYRDPLNLLTDEERGKLWIAMFDYAENETVPEFEGPLAMAFAFIKNQIDRDSVAYEEKCKKNAENGRKGGRPSKNKQDGPFDPNKNPFDE